MLTPVYLCRNQGGVLTERIETEEWVELSRADLAGNVLLAGSRIERLRTELLRPPPDRRTEPDACARRPESCCLDLRRVQV